MIISRLLKTTPEELSQENSTKAVSSKTSPVQKQNTLSTRLYKKTEKIEQWGFQYEEQMWTHYMAKLRKSTT